MKKRALMALPKLTATDEMKQIAASDLPRKEKTTYGYVREVCEYYAYLRCITQDGILKVAFFLPEHLRLNGSNPAYEVYLDKEKRQFITYNSLTQKWCESKLDRLDWKRLYWYAKTSWVSEEDMCLYVTPECFDDPPKTPEVYNDATACVWRDGTWQLLEDTSEGFLLFVQSKSKEEAAA